MPSKEKPPPKDDNSQSKAKPPSVEPVKNETDSSPHSSNVGLYVLAAMVVVIFIGGIFTQ